MFFICKLNVCFYVCEIVFQFCILYQIILCTCGLLDVSLTNVRFNG